MRAVTAEHRPSQLIRLFRIFTIATSRLYSAQYERSSRRFAERFASRCRFVSSASPQAIRAYDSDRRSFCARTPRLCSPAPTRHSRGLRFEEELPSGWSGLIEYRHDFDDHLFGRGEHSQIAVGHSAMCVSSLFRPSPFHPVRKHPISALCGVAGLIAVFAFWDSALFGIQRLSEFSAPRNSALSEQCRCRDMRCADRPQPGP
jgi:hypothetical protein